MEKPKVLVAGEIGLERVLPAFEAAGYEVVRTYNQTPKEEVIAASRGCAAIYTAGIPVDRDLIDAAAELKIISAGSAGVDHIDVAYAASKGIWVGNAGDANSSIVAEHAMYLILALAKKARIMDQLVRSGKFFQRAEYSFRELSSCTLGLIGCGKIASRTGLMAHNGFGMRVLAYDPYISPERAPSCITLVQDRAELLAQADYVSLHLQLNDETRRSYGMTEFRQMKPDACLVNVSRGGVVREDELIEALQAGVIAGAGLDVFEAEPPSADNGLLTMDNVILSPHCAPSDPRVSARMGEYGAKNIIAVLSGQRPPYPVNQI